MFQAKVVEKTKTQFCVREIFFSENRVVYEIMWKNIVELCRPQMTIGACTLHAGYIRLQIHTLRICNSYSFCTVTGCTNAPQCYVILT